MSLIRKTILIILLSFGLIYPVFAAVTFYEGFDGAGYADEDALDTKSGGTGWDAAWTASTSVAVDSAQAQSGTLSVEIRSGAIRGAYRPITTGMGDDQPTFWWRTANSALDAAIVFFKEGTGNRGSFYIANDGNVYICSVDGTGCTGTSITTWSVDTWYCVTVDLDATNDRYRIKMATTCAGGTYSAYKNSFAAFSTIDRIFLYKDSTGNNLWIDEIGDSTAGAGGPPATLEDGWFMIF